LAFMSGIILPSKKPP